MLTFFRCFSYVLCSLFFFFFFFNDTATTEIYTLSLHDALPIYAGRPVALPGACGNPQIPHAPMYTVSGSQSVSVEALDSAHVDPTPNASAVLPWDTVSYTIRVDWDPTFTVTGFWVWVSDTTSNNSTIVG